MPDSSRRDATSDEQRPALKALDVLKDVWREFYASASTSSLRILESLASAEAQAVDHVPPSYHATQDASDSAKSTVNNSEDVEDVFAEYTFSSDGALTTSRVRADVITLPEEVFAPSPMYEHCAPTSRNIQHGDDPHSLAFVPYADDPSFRVQVYTSEYHELGWQNRAASADAFWISLETARRLVQNYGMTLREVDETNVLSVSLREASPCWRRLWSSRTTDCPTWLRPNLPSYENLVGAYYSQPVDANKSLHEMLSTFCSNLNCVQAYCLPHDFEVHNFESDIRYNLPANAYIPRAPEPCKNQCYFERRKANTKPPSGEDERTDLDHIFRLFPEGSSCDLSMLMRMPCYEVYALRVAFAARFRKSKRSREEAKKGETQSNTRANDRASADAAIPSTDHKPGASSPSWKMQFEHCSHRGPCDPSNVDCSCYADDIYCERTCCCPLDCLRRWRGCNCAMERGQRWKLCGGQTCPCHNADRECDPEICDCFHSSGISCLNAEMSRDKFKDIKVAPSAFGFGTFLHESVRKDELICEYTGELIYGPTSETRDIVAQHRGRAYLYALNDTYDVDASYAGSAARFINHASKGANCVTRIKNVSGDHRIGVYAKRAMAPGTELTLDYGDEFFRQTKKWQESSEASTPASSTKQKKTKKEVN